MKNKLFIYSIFMIFLFSCKEKKYEDYNKDDFYETQGIITKVTRTKSPFDNIRFRDIEFIYDLDNDIPLKGSERNIDLFLDVGQPIIVLVYKKDNKISFYGYRGVINLEQLRKGYKNFKWNGNRE